MNAFDDAFDDAFDVASVVEEAPTIAAERATPVPVRGSRIASVFIPRIARVQRSK